MGWQKDVLKEKEKKEQEEAREAAILNRKIVFMREKRAFLWSCLLKANSELDSAIRLPVDAERKTIYSHDRSCWITLKKGCSKEEDCCIFITSPCGTLGNISFNIKHNVFEIYISGSWDSGNDYGYTIAEIDPNDVGETILHGLCLNDPARFRLKKRKCYNENGEREKKGFIKRLLGC